MANELENPSELLPWLSPDLFGPLRIFTSGVAGADLSGRQSRSSEALERPRLSEVLRRSPLGFPKNMKS
jgi:hypothetical protein